MCHAHLHLRRTPSSMPPPQPPPRVVGGVTFHLPLIPRFVMKQAHGQLLFIMAAQIYDTERGFCGSRHVSLAL